MEEDTVESRLTPEAKEEIRNYLWFLFKRGAAVFGIANLVALFGGYTYIVDRAADQAAEEAKRQTRGELDSLNEQLAKPYGLVVDKISESLVRVGQSEQELREINAKAQTLKKTIEEISAINPDQLRQIADVVRTHGNSLTHLLDRSQLNTRLDRLEQRALRFRYKYEQFTNVPSPTEIPGSRGATFCALAGVDDDHASGACFLVRGNAGEWIYQTGGGGAVNDCRYICAWVSYS